MNLPTNRTSGDARDELLRAVNLCHPAWESVGRLTFVPQAAGACQWASWKKDTFSAFLRAHIETAWQCAAQSRFQDLRAADLAFDGQLPAFARNFSRGAGRRLMEDFTPPAGEKLWTKVRTAVAEDKMPGHLATIVALRAATFSLSTTLAIESYLLMEAHGAFGAEPIGLEFISDCLADSGATFFLRVA